MLNDKLRVLLGKASMYSNLYLNPDFQQWKTEIVDKRLESLSRNVLQAEPGSKEQEKFTVRYQELKYICEDLFRIMQNTEDRLRKKEEPSEKG